MKSASALSAWLACGLAFGQTAPASERPDEEAMFSSPQTPTAESSSSPSAQHTPLLPSDAASPPATADAPTTADAATGPAPSSVERDALEGPATRDAFASGEVKDDPLRIGGQFYLRAITQTNDRDRLSRSRFSLPTLLDVYLDGRPSDQLRAYVRGRLVYDPFLSTQSLTTTTPVDNPAVVLDQAWLAFDIARSVFVTAGRERVRWGTARIWNPTDFLGSVRRDPLAQFDARVGVSMVKVHVPVESLGWNFYAIGVFEATQRPGGLGAGSSGSTTAGQDLSGGNSAFGSAGSGTTLGDVGGAFRAEFVFGSTEIGVDGLAQKGRRPRLGIDLSTALGPIDLYAEAAFLRGTDTQRYRLVENPDPALGFNGRFEPFGGDEFNAGVSAGLTYQFAISDTDSLILGAEYFFNSVGYANPELYAWLLFSGTYQPFFTGQHYAALNAILIGPGNWENVTFSLTNLGNMSDLSFISRVDVILRVLTFLQVEVFAGVHYGTRGGEFRLGFDVPAGLLDGQPIPAITVPAPVLDFGIGLRLNI
ncbi:MAG: hypothetical protein ACKVPX_17850 [Myxococcaceae bacterium]